MLVALLDDPGVSWGALGGLVGRSGSALGALLDAFERSWTLLGPLGAILGGFGVDFDRFWVGFTRFVRVLGRFLERFRGERFLQVLSAACCSLAGV